MCKRHYHYALRHGGDPGPVERHRVHPPRPEAVCTVPGCGRKRHKREWCKTHYERWLRNGDPGENFVSRRTDESVGYFGAHGRVVAKYGKAVDYLCVDCGKPAKQWSYVGGCPKERVQRVNGFDCAFSPDPDRYAPRCVFCHQRYDRAA
jgi:hypothetical protein